MQSRLESTTALAAATARDLVRRPGIAVGGIAVVALLGPLPRLGNPAASVADNGALAVELALTSLGIAASLGAGFTGIRMTADGEGTGTAEFLAAPMSATTYLLGRALGMLAVLGAVLVSVLALTGLVWAVIGPLPRIDPPSALFVGALGIWVSAGAFGALGMLLGAWAPPRLAGVLLVLLLALSRSVPASLGGAPGPADWLGVFAPPVSRLEFAREIAFGRDVSVLGVAWGALAATCTGAAALLAAAHRLERRGSG